MGNSSLGIETSAVYTSDGNYISEVTDALGRKYFCKPGSARNQIEKGIEEDSILVAIDEGEVIYQIETEGS